MRIRVLAVGSLGRGPEKELVDDYVKRLPWSCEITEFDFKKPAKSAELRKKQEAEKLITAIPPSAAVIALDERGKSLDSRGLAGKLESWANEGRGTVIFIIGGADGLDGAVRKRADLVLSFGTLTWPHKLVRVMLAEQIYRAWSIQTGHPYHRD